MGEETRLNTGEKLGEQMARHIAAHLECERLVPELSRHFGYSEAYCREVFQEAMHEPVAEFARRLRMEKGAASLVRKKATVFDVAMECCYGSPEAFAKQFRKFFSISPSEFKTANDRSVRFLDYEDPNLFTSGKREVGIKTPLGTVFTCTYVKGRFTGRTALPQPQRQASLTSQQHKERNR